MTVTNASAYTATELQTINNGTSGTISLDDTTVALSGSGTVVAAALDGTFCWNGKGHTGAVEVTGNDYTATELKTINAGTTGTISLDDTTAALSGDATDLAVALGGTFANGKGHTGTVTVTNASDYTVTELKTINAGTTGTITFQDVTVALSGDATDLAVALAGTTNHNGAVTVTNASDYTVTELKTINAGTSGTISLDDTTVALSGDATDLAVALAGTFANGKGHTGAVTVTNASDYTITELKVINAGTSGAITFQDVTVALSGDATDLAVALAGTTNHNGAVTVTNASDYTITELKVINAGTSGTISLDDTTVALSGDATDLAAALGGTFANGKGHTGAVTVSNATAYDATELQTINNGTSGTITLSDRTVALSGSAQAVAEALGGTFASGGSYTGNVTLSDGVGADVTATHITDINDANGSGTITVTSAVDLNGSGQEIEAAINAMTTFPHVTANITGTNYTLTQVKNINNSTDGAIVLADTTTVAFSGDATDIAAALAGTITYTGDVTITDSSYTVTELKAINAKTTGTITFSDPAVTLSGDATDLAVALAGTTNHNATVTVTNGTAYTVTELKVINAGTLGSISFQDTTVALSGDATDLAVALAGTTNHNGAVTVTNASAYTATELQTINNGTSGTISLDDTTVALSGSGTVVAAALAGTFANGKGHTGAVEVTGNITQQRS